MEKMRHSRANNVYGGRPKRFPGRPAAVMALAMILVMLAGCSKLPWGKPTPVSLARAAMKNVQTAKSAEMKADIDTRIAMNVSAINMTLNLDLGVDLDMEMTKDPRLAKGTAEVAVSVMGQNQTMNGEFYLDASDGGTGTTYTRWNGGGWLKQKNKEAKSAADAELEEAQEGDIAAPSSGGNFTETLLQSMGVLKMIAEEAAQAELKEETVTVNDKEAWQINTTLQGTTVREFLSKSGAGLDDARFQSIDWENMKIPAEIYIYKEPELPARIVMECDEIATALLKDAMAQYSEKIPVGEVTATAESCRIDLTFDRYDEIEPISIPQEAKEAKEVDSLVPDVEEMLDGVF